MSSLPPGRPGKAGLFLASVLFLFLELAYIRWFPAQVLFLTFFTNSVLIASFLGLSLGFLAAGHRRNYLRWTPPLMLVAMGAGAGMESLRLALQDILEVGRNTTSPQMVYFGAEVRVHDVASFAVPMELVVGAFFVLIAASMVGVGQQLARLFASIPNPVEAYMVNIGGSLAGILLFQAASWWLPPEAWFTLAGAAIIYFLLRGDDASVAAKWLPAAAALAVPLMLFLLDQQSVGIIRTDYPEETWSPYYRINYSPETRTVVVNLLGHQNMISRRETFPAYAVPYLLNRDSGQPAFRDILIIGAGSGNDVSRALEWAGPDARVDAVEIDPVIQSLGARDHPDHPYQDKRVSVHLNDGRNFLRSTDKQYDLVVFALIDSLVLHSSVSNIRLESYLYTREAMEDVRRRLKPGGLFVMYNYFRQGWIVSRLAKTVETVFARPPVVLTMPARDSVEASARADGFTMFFEGDRAKAIAEAFETRGAYSIPQGLAPGAGLPSGFGPKPGKALEFRPARVETPASLREATDAWPFLYLHNPVIPALSLRGAAVMLTLSALLLWWFGWREGGVESSRLNWAMLLLGAGFMLLETKAVVHMALIFGSTWIVNVVVFSALLVMILLANLWVLRRKPSNLTPYYAALIAALALNVAVPLNGFLGLPPAVRAAAAGALVLSPVLFAGVIFATLIARSPRPAQALAFNTAGSIAGGLAENVTLLIGFQWILALAAAIYAAAWLASRRRGAQRNAPGGA